jgi:outer membrane protein assembly factor BamB
LIYIFGDLIVSRFFKFGDHSIKQTHMRFIVLFIFFSFSIIAFAQSVIPDFATKPSVAWKFKTSKPILSAPVIDENTVYVGSNDSTFYALNLSTGKALWKLKTKGQVRSKCVIADNDLFLNGGDGNLYSIDKKSGKIKWTFATKGERNYDFADYHQSSPLLLNNVLYFGSGDGNFYAVNSTNGKLVWSFATGDVVHTTPAISNNKIFFGSFDGNVYALNLADGSLAWKFKTVGHRYFPKGEVQGSPVIAKNLVIIGARDYNVYALDQDKGFGHWNKAFPRGWVLANTQHDSVVHLAGADERVMISAVPESGREHWKQKMEFLIFGQNVYSDKLMYVGTTIGKFHAINPKTGEKVWTTSTDGYEKNHLKYFKGDDSYREDIYSVIKSNEQFLDAEYELGGIFSTAAISKDYIVVPSTDGTVYCYKR